MPADILIGFLSVVLAGLVGASRIFVPEEAIDCLLRRILRLPSRAKTYSQQIEELTASLSQASSRVDRILREMAEVVRTRQASVDKVDAELASLSQEENQLKTRIEALSQVSIPAAEHFAQLVSQGERRAALRDYALFGGGALVSTIISIALRLAGI